MVEDRKIDIGEITRLHTATFNITTDIGQVVLKALAQTDFDRTTMWLCEKYPEYKVLVAELFYLKDIKAYPKGLDVKKAARMTELTRKASEWAEWYMIECFVEPKLTHPEQMGSLSTEMDTADWEYIYEMLGALTNPMRATAREERIAAIHVKYGVPLADGITAGNITVQQVDLVNMAAAEHVAEQMEGLEIGNNG